MEDWTRTQIESETSSIRLELETVQKALKQQTKRCRQLVSEYTKRLQDKEHQYQSERTLRNDQLGKVLRALLIFEARLKQEQKFISHQLEEKDYLINKQRKEISNLMSNQYCKHCNQFYSPISQIESLDSSSDYVATDYQDYQSSTLESLDSSSETYATISNESETKCSIYQKNKYNKDSLGRRGKKITHKKSIGSYFEALKLRGGSPQLNDYENLDGESPIKEVEDEITNVSERIETIFNNNNSSSNESDCNNTVIDKSTTLKISENIPVFEGDEPESTEKWYASGSDQEMEEQRDVYRNNPVLECMNQILLHNINDSMNEVFGGEKTPNLERKNVNKNGKKVKFSDQDCQKSDYYETPIQKQPNFYESPQSIYSNDYEQIISKNLQEKEVNILPTKKLSVPKDVDTNYYDMDTKPVEIIKKNKILRTPPALPPKPINLVSKYKINLNQIKSSSENSTESEPDYCSISELNLPLKMVKEKINVVAEINASNVLENSKDIIIHKQKSGESEYDPVDVNDEIANLVSKNIEKFSIQLAKQTPIKTENISPKSKLIKENEIPKLPQVSEIIIPEEEIENETEIDKNKDLENDEIITNQDNYVKNNTQILKIKNVNRRPIIMGSTVSSLITEFNNQQLLSEIKRKPIQKKLFSSFENLQNCEKFDLSQNFEEFKLEDCEILEEYDIDSKSDKSDTSTQMSQMNQINQIIDSKSIQSNDEMIQKEIQVPTLNLCNVEEFRKKIQQSNEMIEKRQNEPTYEHFLECTGLSTKSILTPTRLLSNHKSMLKPKDVKLRSKVKSTSVFERHGSTIKYWSEPYI
ncbi:putative leucine-rich repeat-containing protein DDB_G0290503 isoform X2 [Onthophagus taurus]|uniref:putative leucine-rich repeat-containing protein DDB_G0290503 isoform X2 n=1 Tax=Onthophagus taurus TaxID=166361 RepID=UPI000C20476C|nr:uncharacterized protein LOC111422715 [Onthophagus taurus]